MYKIKLLSRLLGKLSIEILENWCLDRLIIVVVPFDSLNSNKVTATKL